VKWSWSWRMHSEEGRFVGCVDDISSSTLFTKQCWREGKK